MNPEIYGYLFDRLFHAGALDVFLTNVMMKKNRPGTKLSVLSRENDSSTLEEIIFAETTTLGIRKIPVDRSALQRQFSKVSTKYGSITVKVAIKENGQVLKYAPEYEECRRQAVKHGVPLQEVYQEAISAAQKFLAK